MVVVEEFRRENVLPALHKRFRGLSRALIGYGRHATLFGAFIPLKFLGGVGCRVE